jgi:hypothetical protein
MSRWQIVPTLVLAAAACAPSTHSTAFRQVAPKSSADQVEVFTEGTPQRPYEELGVIKVAASELSNAHYGDLIQKARIRAAGMGADAIIVSRDPESRTMGLAYVPEQRKKGGQLVSGTARTIETPRIQVSAIAWKESATATASASPAVSDSR